MRSDKLIVQEISDCIEYVLLDAKGLSFDDFVSERTKRNAITWNLSLIGEGINQLSPEFRAAHPQIDWRAIISFRNKVIHEYFNIDNQLVWEVITEDLPELQQKIQAIQFE